MQKFNTVWAVYRKNPSHRDDLLFYCQTKEMAEKFINLRYNIQYKRYDYYIEEIEVLNEGNVMSFVG